MADLGEMRQSAALTTFGVGTMVDFVTGSFMPLGLDYWPPLSELNQVDEPDLVRFLEVNYLQAPALIDDDRPNGSGRHPAVRFPKWLVCSNPSCDPALKRSALGTVIETISTYRMEKVELIVNGIRKTKWQRKPSGVLNINPPTSTASFTSTNGGDATCSRCKKGKGIAPRFVVICKPSDASEEHPGHIDDFPWFKWCHGLGMEKDQHGQFKDPHVKQHTEGINKRLWLKNSGDGLGFEDLTVMCDCGSRRSLQGILSRPADGSRGILGKCGGFSPWLGTRTTCGNPQIAIPRGSTSVHVPDTITFITIPPFVSWFLERLQCNQLLEPISDKWRELEIAAAEADLPEPNPKGFAEREARRIIDGRYFPDSQLPETELLQMVTEVILEKIKPGSSATVDNDNRTRKQQEYEHLSQTSGTPRDVFHTVISTGSSSAFLSNNSSSAFLSNKMEDVTRVERLKAVIAYRGFRREAGGALSGDPDSSKALPLAKLYRSGGQVELLTADNKSRPKFLPAILLRGEGLFFRLSHQALLDFITNYLNDPKGNDRVSQIINKMNGLFDARNETPESRQKLCCPEYIVKRMLVHTLSHLLIRQLTVTCGYGSASLRERLYMDGDDCGFLIYTSTPGAEGSLGGLVRMGDTTRLKPVVEALLEQAKWCSADPICQDSPGQGFDGLNLAACHGCALIPETSCESFRNTFLDRTLVIRPNGSSLPPGFFD